MTFRRKVRRGTASMGGYRTCGAKSLVRSSRLLAAPLLRASTRRAYRGRQQHRPQRSYGVLLVSDRNWPLSTATPWMLPVHPVPWEKAPPGVVGKAEPRALNGRREGVERPPRDLRAWIVPPMRQRSAPPNLALPRAGKKWRPPVTRENKRCTCRTVRRIACLCQQSQGAPTAPPAPPRNTTETGAPRNGSLNMGLATATISATS